MENSNPSISQIQYINNPNTQNIHSINNLNKPIQNSSLIQPQTFTLLDWNILADLFVTPSYFPYVQIKHLEYEYRIGKIKALLKQKDSDIICLQQVDINQNFFNFLKDNDYQYQFRPKGNQGILIAYKKKLFELKEISIIDFDSTISKKVIKPVYTKGHGAIIAKLRTRKGNDIIVATTHLFWDPKFQKVKYHQICATLSEISKIRRDNDSIILTGDFNSLPQSNVIGLVLTNQSPQITKCVDAGNNYQQMIERYEEVKSNLFLLKSSYTQQDGKYTNYTKDFKGRIDYVFYNQYLNVIQIQKLPPQTDLNIQVGLPNSMIPSDHLPLLIKFKSNNDSKIKNQKDTNNDK